MSTNNPLPNPVGDPSKTDEVRYRLRSAYLVMIRAYLRHKQSQLQTASTSTEKEVRDV